MTETRKSSFHIDLSVAQRSAKHALDEVERRTGCKFDQEIKGMVAKMLTGILANVELQGGVLTHGGADKQLRRNDITHSVGRLLLDRRDAKPMARKRWKAREAA